MDVYNVQFEHDLASILKLKCLEIQIQLKTRDQTSYDTKKCIFRGVWEKKHELVF